MSNKKKRYNEERGKSDQPSRGETGENKYKFPIIGIGASAGGFTALKEFLTTIPENAGLTFIVIIHLSPERETHLDELLTKYTKLKVQLLKDQEEIQKNTIYILPPNKNVILKDKKFILKEILEPRGKRLPIDFFFRSLAQELEDKSIGIILSGTGTDGTLGLRVIKGMGGMAIVQDPGEAEYSGMPRSAKSHVRVDYVLPIKQIPNKLLAYVKDYVKPEIKERENETSSNIKNRLEDILYTLEMGSGHDFSSYKTSTLIRRIKKRMTVNQIVNIDMYIEYLNNHYLEVERLFQDILISVTEFFREKDSFKELKEKVIPKIFKRKQKDESVRIWVAGCSTGEEAYSIAILAQEYMNKVNKNRKVIIFASDIDPEAIQKAREGIYPNNIVKHLSEERLNKFFIKKDHIYKVRQDIRNMIVFAVQNALQDPPFSKMDLISCRNVLIYLKSDAQEKLLKTFHYSLKNEGYLFLGNSESVGMLSEFFDEIDKKAKIYKKNPYISHLSGQMRPYPPIFHRNAKYSQEKKEGPIRMVQELNYESLTREIILNNYSPPSVIVNKNNEIIYTFGKTGKFLQLPEGEINMDIVKMAREGLELKLPAVLRKARVEQEEVRLNNISIKTNGESKHINLIVRPIDHPDEMKGLILILFQELEIDFSEMPERKIEDFSTDELADERIKQLKNELKYYRSHLQKTVEELETTNEELKSANEELQSSNEELKSTNEELQTSKEELQSVNEELMTVNNELEAKVEELERTNDDLNNFFSSTEIATIFLDKSQCIKRFTPFAKELFNLIDTDLGRPLNHISSNLQNDNLVDDAKKVQRDLLPIEKDVKSEDNNWYHMRIIPYRTSSDHIEGVVITFFDITKRKKMEQKLKKSEHRSKEAYHRIEFYKDLLLHDIGNVLNIIKTSLKLREMEEKNSTNMKEKREVIDIIKQQVKRGSMLLSNVRSLSKIEEGNLPIEPVNLRKTIEKSVDFVKSLHHKIHVEIKPETTKDIIIVEAGDLLIEAFENIVLNGVIHNESNQVRLVISYSVLEREEKSFVRIEFKDNGIGIPPNRKKLIFKRKYGKGQKSTGMGIGLSLVKRIIKEYGGEIWVENRINDDYTQGSNFIVLLRKTFQ